MGNILLQNQNQSQQVGQGNQLLRAVANLKKMGPSNLVYNQLYNSNPQFRQFADQVGNMTPEQAFRNYGLDYNNFKGYRW